MPPKKKDLAAQKAARDKKMLMILVPVFLVVFVVMVLPKLTASSGAPPAAAAAGTDSTLTTPAATPGSTGTPIVATAPQGPAPTQTTVVAPTYSFSSDEGQLRRYQGKLRSKDPFAGGPASTFPAITTPDIAQAPTTETTTTEGSGPVGVPGSTTPGSTTPGSTTPAAFIYAVISVNGIAEGVALHAPFPVARPMFTLTDIGDSWVKFSLVTGRFTTGSAKVTLQKGHPLTLRNTADGSRFVLRLIAVSTETPSASTTTSGSTGIFDTAPAVTAPAATTTNTTTTPPPPTTPGA